MDDLASLGSKPGVFRTAIWLGILILPVAAEPAPPLRHPQGVALQAAGDAHRAAGAEAALRDYYSANGLLNRGLHELAVTAYGKFLDNHAEHEKAPTARYGLAVCLYQLERYDEAAAELTQLGTQHASQYGAEIAAILGQCNLARKRYAEAAEAFQEVIQNHSRHDLADDAVAGVAEAFYSQGRYD